MSKDINFNWNLDNKKETMKKINILQIALCLACKRVKYFEEMQDKEMGHYEIFSYDTNYDLKALVDDFIEQAKESLK